MLMILQKSWRCNQWGSTQWGHKWGSDPIKLDPIKFSPKESLALDQNSSYFNRIENKKVFPSMQVFFQICDHLDITPGAFLSGGKYV